MQLSAGLTATLFYCWWLVVNGFIFYAEYHFLLRFADIKITGKQYLFLYIGANCVLTLLVLSLQIPGFLREVVHMAILFSFPVLLWKLKWTDVIAPAVIIFTLSTFVDGISVVVMRMLSTNINDKITGNLLHGLLTIALVVLFLRTLRLIAKRYGSITRQARLPHLYTLLLPCGFVIWVIRFGFGLDSSTLASSLAPFAKSPPMWVFICFIGALTTFFVILEVFAKILHLTCEQTEKAILNAGLREQRVYLAEAKKRDDQYRAFQHDIHNHLLILSGLFQEKKYGEAEQYFKKLNAAAGVLLSRVSTGNSVLDVLLREKIGYAEQMGISVSYELHLPKNLSIDDFDLCIVFSNALDNAVQACLLETQQEKQISLIARARHQMLLIEVTNPCNSISPVKPDTGLNNIRHIAEKYQGTLDYEKSNGIFRLSVLLCWNSTEIQPSAKQS